MGVSSGLNARILVDSGADEYVCPTDFASPAPRADQSSMLYDAEGHVIEAHDTRTVYVRLGLEGQSVGEEVRVTNVKSPILSIPSWSSRATSLKQERLGASWTL